MSSISIIGCIVVGVVVRPVVTSSIWLWLESDSQTFSKIRVITKLPNSEQSYKGKVKTHNYINRQNQSTIELFRFEANMLLPSYDRCVLSFLLIKRPIGFPLEQRPELSHIQILGSLKNLCSISMFVAYILSLIFFIASSKQRS